MHACQRGRLAGRHRGGNGGRWRSFQAERVEIFFNRLPRWQLIQRQHQLTGAAIGAYYLHRKGHAAQQAVGNGVQGIAHSRYGLAVNAQDAIPGQDASLGGNTLRRSGYHRHVIRPPQHEHQPESG